MVDMEVKDIAVKANKLPEVPPQARIKQIEAAEASLQKSGADSAEPATQVRVKGVTASVAIRKSANDAINSVNLAVDAVRELDKIVTSISGIVDQAGKDSVAPSRLPALEREANELVSAVREKITPTIPPGSTGPLTGEKIKLEVEAILGRTLEFLLPEAPDPALGLNTVKFSTKESIIQVRTTVAQTRATLDALRESVESIQKELGTVTGEVEVALQNSEASRNSVRDVEAAALLANDAISQIKANPKGALESVGVLSPRAATLLV